MRARICVIFASRYKFSDFFKVFFIRRKRNFIKISVVNLCERINTHDQKERFHQLMSKFLIIYKLTCNKFVKCLNLNNV